MRTDHVISEIEAYLDETLPVGAARSVEAHIEHCATCARHLAEARRLRRELGPAMQAVLGHPQIPVYLRQRVKEATHSPSRGWGYPLRFVNTLGSLAVILVVALGVYVTIRGQLYTPTQPISVASQNSGVPTATVSPTETPQLRAGTSLGDELSVKAMSAISESDTIHASTPSPIVTATRSSAVVTVSPAIRTNISVPAGTIAFPLFDGVKYQTYLIKPDGSDMRPVSLPGVSEPALYPGNGGPMLAARSWNDPEGPRALVTTDVDSAGAAAITHFWEDAQPDWSPVENRLIFASQRESDRLWRLYSVWGDGSLEQNLRRRGKSPTFAPDGQRFAYEGCDDSDNRCGLWLTTLTMSEFESSPVVTDATAKAPDWSPVTDAIVYMANQDDQWDLFVKTLDDVSPRRLTSSPANDGLPVWSPDGQWIAFVSDRDGSWGMWLIHPASGEIRPVTTFNIGAISAPGRLPYNQHGDRAWWDEQLSWGP
jgi:hypothetical protein